LRRLFVTIARHRIGLEKASPVPGGLAHAEDGQIMAVFLCLIKGDYSNRDGIWTSGIKKRLRYYRPVIG
jgi:hypothetical protein